MTGIQDPNTVDLVGQDANGEYIVVMVEDRPWGSSPHQADQLKAKINAYAGYIFDGKLLEHYPEIAGKAVRVQLDCSDAPPVDITAIADSAAHELAKHGIGFKINPRS